MDLFATVEADFCTFSIPNGFPFPSSKNELRKLVDKFDDRLDSDIFVQTKRKVEKTHVVLINPKRFVLNADNLNEHIKVFSSCCCLGDLDDMYFLACLFHEAEGQGEIAQVLKNISFAFGSSDSDLGFKGVPSIVNHNSIDSRLQVYLKDIEKDWNPEWNIIAHLTKTPGIK